MSPQRVQRKPKLPAITRPDGKVYQPRKIVTVPMGDGDELTGIVVFGTHDIRFARLHAIEAAKDVSSEFYGGSERLRVGDDGVQVWFKKTLGGFEDGQPNYWFLPNVDKGRAGVRFSLDVIDQ